MHECYLTYEHKFAMTNLKLVFGPTRNHQGNKNKNQEITNQKKSQTNMDNTALSTLNKNISFTSFKCETRGPWRSDFTL